MKKIIKNIIEFLQHRINDSNRKRLTNKTPTLICSNCTGGLIYHWLGLQFRSPFINLYMDNEDFLTAMENFDEFIAGPLIEDKMSGKSYPVGIGVHGERVHFMHYDDFDSALTKWNERKKRIDINNMAVMLTNFTPHPLDNNATLTNHGANGWGGYIDVIQRFNKLPFKHKLIFSSIKFDDPNVIYLKHLFKVQDKRNIFNTQNIFGMRYIDQFDYVDFINHINE